jgi:DNA invertase Pin-like site-specific DNA recombinase
MKVGYIRVSKQEQNENLQLDALKKEGCENIFTDKISGAKFDRKGLEEAIAYVRSGDTFVVWKLDRLGRSLKHLIDTLNILKGKDVDFISLTEKIDTTTPGGKLIFHFMGALAEFERDLIRERTNAGLEAARMRGRKGGRPKALKTPAKRMMLLGTYYGKKHSINEICTTFGVSRSTLFRYVREHKDRWEANS